MTLVLLVVVCFLFFSSSNLTAMSNQALVPLNITVVGKLIITDAGHSNIRIRTNLNNWRLIAQRNNFISSKLNIDPKDISLSFTINAGSKANPNAAKLIPPFDGITNLSQISLNNPTEILSGTSKTSIDKDPTNKNNWFQLTSTYSIPSVSYSLVSP